MIHTHLTRMNLSIAAYGALLGSMSVLGALDLSTATALSAIGTAIAAGAYYHWAARRF